MNYMIVAHTDDELLWGWKDLLNGEEWTVICIFQQYNYNGAITYNELKEKVKMSISKIPKQSYSNYILYSYKTKEIRTYEPKKSTRRRKLKEYID